MPNKARPKCPSCDSAMQRLSRRGPRGRLVPAGEVFNCQACRILGLGRRRPVYVTQRGKPIEAAR